MSEEFSLTKFLTVSAMTGKKWHPETWNENMCLKQKKDNFKSPEEVTCPSVSKLE